MPALIFNMYSREGTGYNIPDKVQQGSYSRQEWQVLRIFPTRVTADYRVVLTRRVGYGVVGRFSVYTDDNNAVAVR